MEAGVVLGAVVAVELAAAIVVAVVVVAGTGQVVTFPLTMPLN